MLILVASAFTSNAQQVLMLQRKSNPRNFLVVPTPKEVKLKLWNGKIIKGQLTTIEGNEFVIDGSESFPFDSVQFFYFYNPNTYKYVIGTYTGFAFFGSSVLTLALAGNDRAMMEYGELIPVLVFYDFANFFATYMLLNAKRKVDLRSWNKIVVNSPEGNNMRFHTE
ncbi:MAG: hypothetical protein WCI97_05090 [Bacteroidota bacterium]